MTNQSFDNEVKQKMSEHEMPVPPGTWEAIAHKKRKRRFFAFWWMAGAGLVLLGIIGVREILNDNNGKRTDAVAANSEVKKTGSNNDIYEMNVKTDSNSYLDQQNTTGITTSTAQTGTNGNIEDESNRKMTGESTGPLNQSHPLINNSDNSSIQILPATTGKKKKQQTVEPEKPAVEIVNPVTVPGQPGGIVSRDQTEPGSFPSITNRKMITKADLINNSFDYKMTIAELINNPASPDSMLTVDVRESVSNLLKRKRSSWMIDVAVNSFMPVRPQQSLVAITRTTINPMHTAEFRADKIKTVLQPALSYSITVRKKINNRIGIGAGVQYTVIKEVITLSGKETNTHYSVVQRLENGGSGPRLVNDTVANITTGTRVIDAVNSYRYFNLPLSLQYMLINRPDWSLQLNGGVDIGLYAKYNNSISGPLIAENAAGPIVSKQNNTIKTGFFTGLRFSMHLNKNIQWFAEPYLRFNAGRYSNTVINNKAVHQAGVGIGLSFNIGDR